MARKKKTKADPKKRTGADSDDSATPRREGTSKKVSSKKKRAPKKKRARKKADIAETKPPNEALTDEEPVDVDLDAVLDLGADPVDDVQSLIAKVAVLDEEDAVANENQDIVVVDEEADPPEDLDAVLDEGSGDLSDLDELVALTVAGADPADHVTEIPLATLDDDLLVEILDDEPDEPAVLPLAAVAPLGQASATIAREDAASEPDLEDAIDLGPVSSPEVRDRLLAQALAHSELQDARYRVPFATARVAGRWKGAVASLLLLIAAAVAIVPPGWVRPDPPAQIDASERVSSIRTALLLQAQQVDAYRVRFQRLPDSLDDLPARLPGLRLVRSGNRVYQLIGYGPDGRAVIYDSVDPGSEFERIDPSWAMGGAP